MRTGALLIVAVVTCLTGRSAAQAPAAESVARTLQARYDAIRDFSADFVQTYRGGVLRQTVTERGRLIVKKPGKMRWEYRTPEEKLLVADGHKLYFYVPMDRQVHVSDVPDEDRAESGALFLAGKGNLVRDFTIAYGEIEEATSNLTVLELTPRTPEPEYEWLLLGVEPGTLQIRMLVQPDAQGGRSTFTFSNVKENVGIADSVFAFTIPRGVDVVSSDTGNR